MRAVFLDHPNCTESGRCVASSRFSVCSNRFRFFYTSNQRGRRKALLLYSHSPLSLASVSQVAHPRAGPGSDVRRARHGPAGRGDRDCHLGHQRVSGCSVQREQLHSHLPGVRTPANALSRKVRKSERPAAREMLPKRVDPLASCCCVLSTPTEP